MAKRELITADEVRQILSYDPHTGLLRWRTPRPKIRVGQIAGYFHHKGYVCIELNGRAYQAHRVIWLWMRGTWPKGQIDHADTVRSNNQWSNLRDATQSQNQGNSRRRITNSSGLKGVRKGPSKTSPWIAQICRDGVPSHIGSFKTKEEAHEAYCREAIIIHGQFARFE